MPIGKRNILEADFMVGTASCGSVRDFMEVNLKGVNDNGFGFRLHAIHCQKPDGFQLVDFFAVDGIEVFSEKIKKTKQYQKKEGKNPFLYNAGKLFCFITQPGKKKREKGDE